MRVVIVSDAHLSDPRSDRQADFVGFIDGLRDTRLVLLGDVFHAWAGLEGEPPAAVGPALAAFARLKKRNVPVTFVPGNHELRAGAYLSSTLGWTVRDAHTDRSLPRSVLFAHGDEADSRAGYRAVRRVLRSPLFLRLLDGLPPAGAQGLLDRLAGSPVALLERDPDLVALQRRWACRRLAGGVSVVVMGHSHVAGFVDMNEGFIVHTGAWAGLRTWVTVDERGVRLLRREAAGDAVLDARRWPSGA